MDKFLYIVEKETPNKRIHYSFTCPTYDARIERDTNIVLHLYYFRVQRTIYDQFSFSQISREIKDLDVLTLQNRQGTGYTWDSAFKDYSDQHYAYLNKYVQQDFAPIQKNEAIAMEQKYNRFDKNEGISDFYDI